MGRLFYVIGLGGIILPLWFCVTWNLLIPKLTNGLINKIDIFQFYGLASMCIVIYWLCSLFNPFTVKE